MKRIPIPSISFLIVLFLTFVVGCTPENSVANYDFNYVKTYDPAKYYIPKARWEKLLVPEQAGWSSSGLQEASDYAREIHSDALLVVYNGLVILATGKYQARFKIHSIRKSLMSIMYGTLVDKGIINTDMTLQKLKVDDISGLSNREKQATVHNLLTSKSGVYHPAAYETKGMRKKRPQREAYKPGEFWYYNNWDFNVLATIFNQHSERDFFEAFNIELATPLGMEQFRIDDTRYYYDKEKSHHPAYLFKMSALDLARVGLLYLRKGNWRGQQIISQNWVDLSTSAIHRWKKEKSTVGYGYLWKIASDGYYAAGVGGQRLYIMPEHNLVIVHSTDTSKGKKIKSKKIKGLFRKILKAYKPGEYPVKG